MLGLLFGYLIVTYINEIHSWIGHVTGHERFGGSGTNLDTRA